jgi:hypothetical protein
MVILGMGPKAYFKNVVAKDKNCSHTVFYPALGEAGTWDKDKYTDKSKNSDLADHIKNDGVISLYEEGVSRSSLPARWLLQWHS